jgi:hypothetical protein
LPPLKAKIESTFNKMHLERGQATLPYLKFSAT